MRRAHLAYLTLECLKLCCVNATAIDVVVTVIQLHVVQTFKMPMNEFEEARSSHSFQSLAAIARQSECRRPNTREGSQGVSQSRASSAQLSQHGAASPSSTVNPPSASQQNIALATLKVHQSASNSQNISANAANTTTTGIPIEIEA